MMSYSLNELCMDKHSSSRIEELRLIELIQHSDDYFRQASARLSS